MVATCKWRSEINCHNVKKAGRTLRAFNLGLRQNIIKTLHEERLLTVTQVYCELRVEQAVASQHPESYAGHEFY